jgi:hypothetical protein
VAQLHRVGHDRDAAVVQRLGYMLIRTMMLQWCNVSLLTAATNRMTSHWPSVATNATLCDGCVHRVLQAEVQRVFNLVSGSV